MKIALVVLGFHHQLGGYGSHVYEFAKMLKGHDVTILTSTFSPKGELPEGLHKEGGVNVLRFKTSVKNITPGLYSHLKKTDYDLVLLDVGIPEDAVSKAKKEIGLEFMKELNEKNIKFASITGYEDDDEVRVRTKMNRGLGILPKFSKDINFEKKLKTILNSLNRNDPISFYKNSILT